MISVEEARERILAELHPMPAEIVALADAWARVSGQVGVLAVTAGCGLTNAVTGLCVAGLAVLLVAAARGILSRL